MIRVAIIGTGNISAMHLKGYLAFPERCKITALVDIYPEKAEAKKAEYGLDARVFASHKEILDDPDVDLVSIARRPTATRKLPSISWSTARMSLWKSHAASLEECDAMIAAPKRREGLLRHCAEPLPRSDHEPKKTLDSGLAAAFCTPGRFLLVARHCYSTFGGAAHGRRRAAAAP
jgi:hypothetical protein